MYDHTMPLYPAMGPGCGGETCARVPLCGDGGRPLPGMPPDAKRVLLDNPCCPGECVEVLLGVDACGNLAVCVRRQPCCPPPHRRGCEGPRRDCRKPPRWDMWPEDPCRRPPMDACCVGDRPRPPWRPQDPCLDRCR